jgi:hypothetical protein
MRRLIFIYLFLLSSFVLADVEDTTNLSYEAVKTKHASKKNNECNIYVDINGNEDWKEKKDELNTIIEKSNKCREIVIYKSIKNVDTVNGNGSNGFDINIGAIIKKHRNLNIRTITIIENSTIKGGYFNSNSNVGNSIGSNSGSTYANNVRMESNIKINDSQIGSDFLGEMGMDMLESLGTDISSSLKDDDFFKEK